jgi:hypothetical protein
MNYKIFIPDFIFRESDQSLIDMGAKVRSG